MKIHNSLCDDHQLWSYISFECCRYVTPPPPPHCASRRASGFAVMLSSWGSLLPSCFSHARSTVVHFRVCGATGLCFPGCTVVSPTGVSAEFQRAMWIFITNQQGRPSSFSPHNVTPLSPVPLSPMQLYIVMQVLSTYKFERSST